MGKGGRSRNKQNITIFRFAERIKIASVDPTTEQIGRQNLAEYTAKYRGEHILAHKHKFKHKIEYLILYISTKSRSVSMIQILSN